MSDSLMSNPVGKATIASAATVESDLPEVMRTPTKRKSMGWNLLLALGNMVIFMCLIPATQILIPNQLALLDAAHKTTLLSLAVLLGAIPALVGNLLGGALSDRTTSRFGRRRPWVLSSALVITVGMVVLALAPNYLVIVVGYSVLVFAVSFSQSALVALVPDQVPVEQRAFSGAFFGFSLPLGVVIGIAAISNLFHGTPTTYYVLTAVMLVATIFFVIFMSDPPLPKESVKALDFGKFLASFVVPFKRKDFSLVFLGRIFVTFGYYVVNIFLIFYMQDKVGITDQTQVTALAGIFQLLLTICVVISTIVSGRWSDRIQKRKPFVIGSGILMAASLVILGLVPQLPVVMAAGAIMGLGFGAFLANDLALQTQVLPSRRDSGKDLGIFTVGSLLPQVLVPVVIGGLLAILSKDYLVAFTVSAVLVVVGSLVIIPVRSVR
jgi:MFS family permease